MKLSRIKTLIAAPDDGKPGLSAASAVFSPPVLWVNADKDGWSTGDQKFTITPRVAVNGTLLALEGAPTAWLFPDGIKVIIDPKAHDIEVEVPDHTDYENYEGEAEFILTAEAEGVEYNVRGSFSIVAKRKGEHGENGKDGITYEILPSVANIKADNEGNILTGVIQISAYKIEGETRKSCGLGLASIEGASVYWVQYKVDDGPWTDCKNVSIGSGMLLGYGVPASVVSTTKNGIAFRLAYGTSPTSYTIVHEIAQLQIVKDGQPGAQGKSGRFYYYDGYFVANKEYKATDHQAPYVAFDWTDRQTVNGVETDVVRTNYYMLAAESNKNGNTYIAPRTTAATGVWELMETSFKYIIAQAFFSDFAKLGSAVFSGDWMISQHGKINGVASTNYVKFNEKDPQGDDSGNFCPNYAIDLLTGKTYLNDAVIRGTVHATDGEFTGIVHATGGEFSGVVKTALMYSKNIIVEGTHNIDPVKAPAYMYIVNTQNETHTCVLPVAVDYDGLELRFYSPKTMTRSGDFYLYVKTRGTDVIVHKKIDTSSGNVMTERVTSCRINNGNVVTLKSMNGDWAIISGETIGITEWVEINGRTLYFDDGILVEYK